MATATVIEQRLTAEAAQGRRGEQREREKRLAAERELKEVRRTERVQSFLDPHNVTPSADLLAAWEPCQARMREHLDEATWRIWGEPVHPHKFDGTAWWLACPASCRDWVVERFGRVWEWACGAPVRFVICDQTNTNQRSS